MSEGTKLADDIAELKADIAELKEQLDRVSELQLLLEKQHNTLNDLNFAIAEITKEAGILLSKHDKDSKEQGHLLLVDCLAKIGMYHQLLGCFMQNYRRACSSLPNADNVVCLREKYESMPVVYRGLDNLDAISHLEIRYNALKNFDPVLCRWRDRPEPIDYTKEYVFEQSADREACELPSTQDFINNRKTPPFWDLLK
jgi:hypothetical protein